ncbi:hypothetical protein TNCV_3495381 [Trichonephila clavipes]|nr:hypothetical protein TNCV_3495381 [Trichonephila clavipes]
MLSDMKDLAWLCSLVVKVTDSWLAIHEFVPSSAEDPLYRGNRCSLNLSRLKRPPICVMRKLVSGGLLRCCHRHLTLNQRQKHSNRRLDWRGNRGAGSGVVLVTNACRNYELHH